MSRFPALPILFLIMASGLLAGRNKRSLLTSHSSGYKPASSYYDQNRCSSGNMSRAIDMFRYNIQKRLGKPVFHSWVTSCKQNLHLDSPSRSNLQIDVKINREFRCHFNIRFNHSNSKNRLDILNADSQAFQKDLEKCRKRFVPKMEYDHATSNDAEDEDDYAEELVHADDIEDHPQDATSDYDEQEQEDLYKELYDLPELKRSTPIREEKDHTEEEYKDDFEPLTEEEHDDIFGNKKLDAENEDSIFNNLPEEQTEFENIEDEDFEPIEEETETHNPKITKDEKLQNEDSEASTKNTDDENYDDLKSLFSDDEDNNENKSETSAMEIEPEHIKLDDNSMDIESEGEAEPEIISLDDISMDIEDDHDNGVTPNHDQNDMDAEDMDDEDMEVGDEHVGSISVPQSRAHENALPRSELPETADREITEDDFEDFHEDLIGGSVPCDIQLKKAVPSMFSELMFGGTTRPMIMYLENISSCEVNASISNQVTVEVSFNRRPCKFVISTGSGTSLVNTNLDEENSHCHLFLTEQAVKTARSNKAA